MERERERERESNVCCEYINGYDYRLYKEGAGVVTILQSIIVISMISK